MAREGIGLKAARMRSIAGLTQQDVADRVGAILGRPITREYISMIENGKRPVDKRSVLIALAEALHMSVTDLTGQPYPPATRGDLDLYMAVPSIRAAIEEPDETVVARPIRDLAFAADRAMAARMSCDTPSLGVHLPGLLAETRVLWVDQRDEQAGMLLVQAAYTAALALKPGGWVDLAVRCAELADTVATNLGDPVSMAAANFALAQCALANGSRRRSYTLAVDAATLVESPTELAARPDEALAWYTMLHLHAALTAASLHRADDAASHLATAAAAARRVTGDPWRMEATPANVDTWAVGIALENGDAGRAPELARRVDVTQLRSRQRRSRIALDTGRGLFETGDHDGAVHAFLRADDIAPGDLRGRSTVIEIVSHILRATGARGGSEALQALAQRVGVDPFAEPVGV